MVLPNTNRMLLLLAFHVIAGILAASVTDDQPAVSTAIFFGLVFCQVSLLGMWAALGSTRWYMRLIGLTAGTVYLFATTGYGIDELSPEFFWLIALPTSLVGAVCFVLRLFKVTLCCTQKSRADVQEGLQFTIRHLMILTFVVACLITLIKNFAPVLSGARVITIIAVLGLCYAAVAVASLWATLGFGNVIMRSLLAMLIALGAGWAGESVVGHPQNGFWFSGIMLQAAILVGSLLIVRSSGYRLLRWQSKKSVSYPESTTTPTPPLT